MSPFRDAPHIELGPLSVGLKKVAVRAMLALPSGGRVVSARRSPVAAHVAGALGSAGLLLVAVAACVAKASRWHPTSGADIALCVAGVIVGGLSLATIFRAKDRAVAQLTRPGALVGHGARLVLRRVARLADHAERWPEQFGARSVAALRRALGVAEDPEIGPWIPADVRGRCELLIARAEAQLGGPCWADDEARRSRVHALLEAAAGHLADPSPAEADLAAMARAPSRRRAAPERRARVRFTGERSRVARVALPPEPLAPLHEPLADDDTFAPAPRRARLERR